ncbi:MAG TPA: EamA family transporter [Aestuariivirga sp.]
MATQKVMGAKEWALLLILSVLWGGSFFFIGVAVKELPPLTIMMLRVGIAALILHVVIRAMGQWMPRDPKVWLAFGGMGLLNNVIPQTLIVWGQTQIPSGLASILNATTPLFAVLVAHVFTSDERMTGKKLAGVVIGFMGVAIMVGPAALSGLGSNIWAQLAILLASVFYAISGVYGRRFKQMGVTPMMTATGQLTASTLMLTPLALAVDHSWTLTQPSFAAWSAIAGLAILSTALAYLIFFRILASSGATNLLLVTFLIPISAVLLGFLFLGEQLELRHFAGMGLIGLGLAAIDGRLLTLRGPRVRTH